MEDTHCCHDNYLADVTSSFFAIYDGYRGQNAAAQCAAHLHVHLRRELQHVCSQQHVDQRRVSNAFRRAYSSVEKLLLLNSENERLHSRWSGCSAVTCVLTPGACYLGNVGDVAAILIRCDDVVKVLTRKHDLYDKKERARVREKNGLIVKSEKSALINGALAVTRGIGNLGDGGLKSCIINEPRARCVALGPADQLLVLGSSGFWKVFDYEEVAYLVSGFMKQVKSEARRSLLAKLTTAHAECHQTGHESPSDRLIRRSKSSPCVYCYSCYGNDDVSKRPSKHRPKSQSCPSMWTQHNGYHRNNVTNQATDHDNQNKQSSFHGDGDVRGGSPPGEEEVGLVCRGELVPLSLQQKEQLLARKLAERLVRSALLAGSLDNVTVIAVLLPGFSLVPWNAVTDQVFDCLEGQTVNAGEAWPHF